MKRLVGFFGVLILAGQVVGAEKERAFDPEEKESIAAYLRSLTPRSEEEISGMIAGLSSEDFAERQRALRDLSAAAAPMREFLEKRRDASKDAEVRKGISRALAHGKKVIPSPMKDVAEAVLQKGHRGLAAELVGVARRLEDGNGEGKQRFFEAARLSADEGDREGLVDLLGSTSPVARELAARVLPVFKVDFREDVRPLLKDAEAAVRLAAAEVFAGSADSACFPVLAELASGEDFYLRWRASERLRQLTGGAILIDPMHAPAVVDLAEWDEVKELKPMGKLEPITLLGDGSELESWHRATKNLYDEVELEQHEGFVRIAGTGYCLFSPPLRFQNYRLRIDWRFPGGAPEPYPDSGIFLAKFPGKRADKYGSWERGAGAIQVQIRHGFTGMFCSHGAAIAGGRMFQASSEPYTNSEIRGGWNTFQIEERDGQLRVWLNGVRVNWANGLNRGLTTIGLGAEGFVLDYRNVTIEPLPGALVGGEPEPEEAKDAR